MSESPDLTKQKKDALLIQPTHLTCRYTSLCFPLHMLYSHNVFVNVAKRLIVDASFIPCVGGLEMRLLAEKNPTHRNTYGSHFLFCAEN